MSRSAQDRQSGSLTGRIAKLFVKGRPRMQQPNSSLAAKAEEPEVLPADGGHLDGQHRSQPYGLFSSLVGRKPLAARSASVRPGTINRKTFQIGRSEQSSSSALAGPPSAASNSSTVSPSFQKIQSLQERAKEQAEEQLEASVPYVRYSLPLTSGLEFPLGPLRPLNQEYPSLADLQVINTIGVGTFARVKLVRHQQSGAHLALKSLKKVEVLRLKQLQHVLNEKNVLAKVNHPFIVRLHSAYQDDDRLYMLMEYAPGGELFRLLNSQYDRCFPLHVACFYAASIVLALEYLHSNGIIYRDLKPENLLLDQDGYLKMTDFGFAKEIGSSNGRTWTLCGTPEYLAPEIIKNEGHGKAVDWWSLGVILYEMLVGRTPFTAGTSVAIYKRVVAGDFELPATMDPHAQDLIRQLLAVVATRRLGNLKGGVQDIKRHPLFAGIVWRDLLMRTAVAPFRPEVSHVGHAGNYEQYAESFDDPHSPMLDLAQAQRIFRGF